MKKDDKNAKPSKVKIEMAFDRCKDSVQELLDQYQATIDGYLAKMVALKKEGRLVEADRYKQKLKLVLGRQAKMNDLMDQVEQFSYMIDEAFAKSAVFFGSAASFAENKASRLSQLAAPLVPKLFSKVSLYCSSSAETSANNGDRRSYSDRIISLVTSSSYS